MKFLFFSSSICVWWIFHLWLQKTATCIANIEPARHGDYFFQNRAQSESQSCDKPPKVRSDKEYSETVCKSCFLKPFHIPYLYSTLSSLLFLIVHLYFYYIFTCTLLFDHKPKNDIENTLRFKLQIWPNFWF